MAHCPATFLRPVKILAKCRKVSLVLSKEPAAASALTAFADASKVQSDAGSDLTCLVSFSLRVLTLLIVQRQEGGIYTQLK